MKQRMSWWILGVLLLGGIGVPESLAQQPDRPGEVRRGKSLQNGNWQQRPANPRPQPEPVPRPRQRHLIHFVREHHPDLERLLETLEKRRPEKYQAAMRRLNQAVRRIEQVEGDPEKHKTALAHWKLRSRVDLVAARLAIRDEPKLRMELEQLIGQLLDIRAKQLAGERNRANDRLSRIDQQLNRLNETRQQGVQQLAEAKLTEVRRTLGLAKKKDASRNGNARRDANRPNEAQRERSRRDKRP